MIIITTPILPDYVTAWSWEEERNPAAGMGYGGSIYHIRFNLDGNHLNVGLCEADVIRAQTYRGEGSWQQYWDKYFAAIRAKIDAKKITKALHDGRNDGEAAS